MWKTDFDGKTRTDTKPMSVEDRRAIKITESSITHENEHYKLGLPWREEDTTLTNNMAPAHARLLQMKRKLLRNTSLHQRYSEAVNDFIAKGYAKEVTNMDANLKRV